MELKFPLKFRNNLLEGAFKDPSYVTCKQDGIGYQNPDNIVYHRMQANYICPKASYVT